jgi:hypothetical protein
VPVDAVRFNRLGGACPQQAASATCPVQAVICPEARCNDNTSTDYKMRAAGPVTSIRMVDQRGGVSRTLEIAPGGRVVAQ